MLFGAPQSRLPEMKQQIKVGSTVFLYNKEAKVVMGPYSATVEPGWKLELQRNQNPYLRRRTYVRKQSISLPCDVNTVGSLIDSI